VEPPVKRLIEVLRGWPADEQGRDFYKRCVGAGAVVEHRKGSIQAEYYFKFQNGFR
jgi:hypothetical protein